MCPDPPRPPRAAPPNAPLPPWTPAPPPTPPARENLPPPTPGFPPYYGEDLPDAPGKPHLRFSLLEGGHLAGALALLSLGFLLWRSRLLDALLARPLDFSHVWPTAAAVLGGVVAIATGFVLHEVAHKVVAQRYGHWAEFRASFKLLLLSLGLALFGLWFAAPGAVLIRGRVSQRQNGIISLAGPATNFVLALASWPFALQADQTATSTAVAGAVADINAFLCVFNLMPFTFFGNTLDGRKVFWWNKPLYFISLGAAAALLVGILLTTGAAQQWSS